MRNKGRLEKNLIESFVEGQREIFSFEALKQEETVYVEKEGEKALTVEEAAEKRATFIRIYRRIGILLGVVFVGIIIYAVTFMPPFGKAEVPTSNEVTKKYLEEGEIDTGAANAVAGMILDYRAFDTLGESTVLFTATGAVFILLFSFKKKEGEEKVYNINPSKDPIAINIARFIIPLIFIFGIYIVLNGHLSPGGGFSGGAVIGAGFILYASIYGTKKASKFFNMNIYTGITSVSLLTYAVLKCYSFYTGANHIESNIPKGEFGSILSGGFILPLNICVGLVVASTMFAFYMLFTEGEL